MTTGAEVFDILQRRARSEAAKTGKPAPTSEYLTRHLLESFLDRLTQTEHADGFVLKGEILLAAYGVRRPTKDIDAAAVSAAVTPEQLRQIVRDIAAVDADDGVLFDLSAITVQEIRDDAAHAGLRLPVPATIGPWKGVAAWDVSTGDPTIPAPQLVSLPRFWAASSRSWATGRKRPSPRKPSRFSNAGSRAPAGATTSTSANSSSTTRSTATSCSHPPGPSQRTEVSNSAPIAPRVVDYGEIAQAKWSAWRRKEHLEDMSEADLDAQLARVSAYIDSVFG